MSLLLFFVHENIVRRQKNGNSVNVIVDFDD